MLDLFRTISTAAMIGAILAAVLSVIPNRRGMQLIVGGGAGAWVGLVAALTASGAIAWPGTVGILFASPLLLAGGSALLSARARSWMLALPQQLLIRLNTFRLLGLFMVMMAFEGRLSGPFPYFAGIGDAITGALALPAAALIASHSPRSRILIGEWNLFGALDLVVAVALGITSINGSPLQLIHAGVGAAGMLTLPWILIPTTLVPFYLICHGIVFAQLRAQKALQENTPANSLRQPAL